MSAAPEKRLIRVVYGTFLVEVLDVTIDGRMACVYEGETWRFFAGEWEFLT